MVAFVEDGHARPLLSEPLGRASLDHDLGTRLWRLVARRPGLQGVHVEDERGRVLFSRHAELLFNPASNVKLVTVAASLARLGGAHRFITELLGVRGPGGAIRGPLFLRGGGDPTLESADLLRLCTLLAARGVRSVGGPIIVDGSYFQLPAEPPGYRHFGSSGPFRALPSALTVNDNVVRVSVAPGQAGEAATVSVEPPSGYVSIIGKVHTSRWRTRLAVRSFRRGTRGTGISVSGWLAEGAQVRRSWRRVYHPDLYAGHSLLRALAAAGVAVERPLVRVGRVPRGTHVVAHHRSVPLAEMVRTILKDSVNVRAELLLLAVGRARFGGPGTYRKGRAAIAEFLAELGIAQESFYLENGSGLSKRSRFRPVDMVRLLRMASQRFALGPELLSALPVAGLEGTVALPFRRSRAKGQVRAKTGTLNGISCLSGYVADGGRMLFFSFMSSRSRRTWRTRRRHVAMTELLLESLRRHPSR